MADSSKRLGQETLNLQMLGSRCNLAGSNLSSADSVGAEQCPQDTSTLCTALNGQVTRNW